MKKILLFLTILFFANQALFAEGGDNLHSKNVVKSSNEQFLRSPIQAKCISVWQCWSYDVEGCCGLNGTACGYSYDEVISIIEDTIKNFCPTCSCDV